MPLRYESNLMKPSARLAGLVSDGITEEEKKKRLFVWQAAPTIFGLRPVIDL